MTIVHYVNQFFAGLGARDRLWDRRLVLRDADRRAGGVVPRKRHGREDECDERREATVGRRGSPPSELVGE